MKSNFVLMTDTGSDLPKTYYAEHAIECIPLGFTLDERTYGGDDGAEMDVKEFYAKLRGGALPKTFQATPAQIIAHMTPYLERGQDILAIPFSSGLSGTCESYRIAAKELGESYPARKIYVVDSLAASLGQGLLVDYAVKKAESGASIEETRDFTQALVPHMCHFFTVNDLYHLKRGGRVSGATAMLGSLLKIKPVLHVDEHGHLVSVGKAMGRKKSIAALLTKMTEFQTLEEGDPIFISHGDCLEDAQTLAAMVEQRFGKRDIFISEIGSVIGTHSGAGTVALFFKGKQR